jgi:hypothetical protein
VIEGANERAVDAAKRTMWELLFNHCLIQINPNSFGPRNI